MRKSIRKSKHYSYHGLRTTLTIDEEVLKTAMKIGINVSQFCENALKEAIEKLKSPRTEPNGGSANFSISEGSVVLFSAKRESSVMLRPGFEPGFPARKNLLLEKNVHQENLSLNWFDFRDDFEKWLLSKGYSDDYQDDVLSYLGRYVKEIQSPLDVMSCFTEIKKGKRHLVLALRTLFNFYEVLGIDKGFLDSLRKGLPRVKCGIDLKIPDESHILNSLKEVYDSPVKYRALYNLLLDSGLRLVEAVELINNFKQAEEVNGFFRCQLAMFRGEKQAYYAHFSVYTLELLKEVREKIEYRAASIYFQKHHFILAKYLRKYAFDKMIELEIPESIADFIEGRVPQKIGAKHYMALARQSSKFYPRYLQHLESLRGKS